MKEKSTVSAYKSSFIDPFVPIGASTLFQIDEQLLTNT